MDPTEWKRVKMSLFIYGYREKWEKNNERSIQTCLIAVTVMTKTSGKRLVVGLTGVLSRMENCKKE